MNKWIVTALSLSFALTLTACGKKDSSQSGQAINPSAISETASAYHKISAEEAKEKMETETVVIVDVRTPEEYAEGHIPGALSVPLQTIGDEMPEALPDTNANLLIYCRSGVRSKQAADKLVQLGYEQVYDFGGILDWPYETQKEEDTP